eukprot:scaffold191960_cov18-Prasinocladus_malaysianus.AAC.1
MEAYLWHFAPNQTCSDLFHNRPECLAHHQHTISSVVEIWMTYIRSVREAALGWKQVRVKGATCKGGKREVDVALELMVKVRRSDEGVRTASDRAPKS